MEAAEDGTFVRGSGQALRNVKFASVEQGKATVEMEDGSTVSLSDVSFADVGQEMVATGITGMEHVSVTSANGIWQVFRQGNYGDNAGEFTKAAMQTFRAGFMGDATVLKQGDSRSAALDPVHAEMIYQMGRLDAEAHYNAQQAKVDAQKKAAAEKNSTAEKKGGVYYGYEGQTIDQRKVDKDHKRLTKAQRVGIDFVKRLSKKFGTLFYFYESYTDAQGNRVYKDRDGNVVQAEKGYYDPKDGSIHIDLTGDTILFTIAHELGHQIKDWSPKQFKKMADIVMDGFSSNDVPLDVLISQQQALAREHGRELTEDEAFEEVICNALEGVMADGKVAQFLQQLEGRDKSLGARVRRFFHDIAQLIRDTLDAYAGVKPDSVEGIMISELEDTYKQLQKALAEGIYQAGENFRQAEKNSTGEGGVRYKVLNGIVAENGIVYDKVVQPGTVVYEKVKRNHRDYIAYLHQKIFKRRISIFNANGENIVVEFAKDTDVVKKDGASNSHRVLGELERTTDRLKMISVINIKELLQNSTPEPISNEHSHQWLDEFGWQDRKATMLDRGELYPVILHIANARDGRHILYDLSVIKKERTGYDTDAKAPSAETARAPDATNGHRSAVKNPVLLGESVPQPESGVNHNSTTDSDGNRFSVRQEQNPTVADMLKKENEKLKGDVEKLKELLKLQRSITGGTKFTASSVEAAARVLKKSAGATGNTAELAGILNRFYEYIATEQELTWEGVKEQAQAAVEWLQSHVKHQRSDYAQEILDQLHGSRISLDESQKQEAAHRFGSFNAFRQAVMGSITVANEANTSLDSFWQEMSALYPDVFDAEMTAADMPGALADVIYRLRNEDTSLLEYAYNREMIEQDLVRQVYDTYWNVSTLRTFADVKQGQINRLKSEHLQRMQQLKAENREKVEQMKAGHRAEVQMIRNAYRQRLDTQQKQIVQRYQESRAKAVEGRHKTEMRHKIRKVVKKLNDLLLKETKDKYVPEELKRVVAEGVSCCQ